MRTPEQTAKETAARRRWAAKISPEEKRKRWPKPSPARKAAIMRKHRYGITQAQFDALLAQQENACTICKRPNPNHLDHCHETGKIRGVLCNWCNKGLGFFGDNTIRMQNAIEYVLRNA